MLREPQVFGAKVFNQTFFAILSLMVWWHVGFDDGPDSLRNMAGAIFYLITNQILGYFFGAMLIF